MSSTTNKSQQARRTRSGLTRSMALSFAAALGCHAAVFMGLPGYTGFSTPPALPVEPPYLEVILAEPPAPAPEFVAAPPTPLTPQPEPEEEPPFPEPIAVAPPEPVASVAQIEPVSNPPEQVERIESNPRPADSTRTSAESTPNTLATGTEVGTGEPTDSKYQWINEPYFTKRATVDYPQRARQKGQEGVVVLSLFINTRGTLDKVEIAESSGYELLDAAAIKAAQRSRFRPGEIGGQPVPCRAEVPYRFKLRH